MRMKLFSSLFLLLTLLATFSAPSNAADSTVFHVLAYVVKNVQINPANCSGKKCPPSLQVSLTPEQIAAYTKVASQDLPELVTNYTHGRVELQVQVVVADAPITSVSENGPNGADGWIFKWLDLPDLKSRFDSGQYDGAIVFAGISNGTIDLTQTNPYVPGPSMLTQGSLTLVGSDLPSIDLNQKWALGSDAEQSLLREWITQLQNFYQQYSDVKIPGNGIQDEASFPAYAPTPLPSPTAAAPVEATPIEAQPQPMPQVSVTPGYWVWQGLKSHWVPQVVTTTTPVPVPVSVAAPVAVASAEPVVQPMRSSPWMSDYLNGVVSGSYGLGPVAWAHGTPVQFMAQQASSKSASNSNSASSIRINDTISISSLSTENSLLTLTVRGDDSTQIRAAVRKDGVSGEAYFGNAQPVSGVAKIPLYLRYGAGSYSLVITTSDSKNLASAKLTNLDSQDRRYSLPSNGVNSDAPEIIALSQSLTEGLFSDRQKAIAIHDWVTANITYGTISQANATDVLQAKATQCKGYSYLTAALLRVAGIQTKVQVALYQGFAHAWVLAWIGERWVMIDTTWDAAGWGYKWFDPKPAVLDGLHQSGQDEDNV